MSYHFTFLRHGESEGNALGVLQGRSDYPLSEQGREQARRLGERWQAEGITFDLAISSPLLRARQTAEIIAGILQSPLEIEEIWIERSFGRLDGQAIAAIRSANPAVNMFAPYTPIGENGESTVDVYTRALLALQSLVNRPPGRYLIVTHGALLTRLIYAILGITPQGHLNSVNLSIGNTAYLNFTYNPENHQWRWYAFNNLEEWDGWRHQEK